MIRTLLISKFDPRRILYSSLFLFLVLSQAAQATPGNYLVSGASNSAFNGYYIYDGAGPFGYNLYMKSGSPTYYLLYQSNLSAWVIAGSTGALVDFLDADYYDLSTDPTSGTWYFNTGASSSISIVSTSLPVELTSFTASVSNLTTVLAWKTATEVNNAGFEIERISINNHSLTQQGTLGSAQSTINSWSKVGFVAGNGTSNAPHHYSYADNVGTPGTYSYRLKQIDHDGAFIYSQEVHVQAGSVPNVFTLGQNYPNPFNPSTSIQFTVPADGKATLKIFNALGQEVATLFDGEASAGMEHQVQFNASNLASGMYFSRLEFGGKTQIKKMTLLK